MIGVLPYKKSKDQNGKAIDVVDLPVADYKPSQAVKELTQKIQKDYQIGYEINHRSFTEFNDMDLLTRMDVDQKAWNGYVQPKSDDPEEDWRWNGVTDITRNKVLLTAAHLSADIMYPGAFAQDENNEEDKMASYVMGDMLEFNISHSDYELTFVYGAVAALVNPVAYIQVDYAETYQTIKEKANGKITTAEVLDKEFSGFQFSNVPADEIMIANAYQYYIQKQRFIIRKRYIDFDEAQAKYGIHDNFQYVSPGIKTIFNGQDGMFYNQVNEEAPTLCEETIYYNRREDAEIPFINGIYVGDEDVNANLIKHRDNKNRSRYPYVKFGAEPIDEKRFYFYKSYSAKLSNKQELYDQMWRAVIDATTQEVRPSLAIIGAEDTIDGNIAYPGSQHTFSPETKIETIGLTRNTSLGMSILEMIKTQMAEDTQSDQLGGKYEGGDKTKYEVGRIEANARINLGLLGKMMVQMVKDMADLMKDDIIRYQTTGELTEIVGGETAMKYKSFLLAGKSDGGKEVSEKIQFDGSMIGKKMTKNERLKEGFKLKKIKDDKGIKIIRVNPQWFARLDFMITLEAVNFAPRNKRLETMLELEKYDKLVQNPLLDQRQVTLDFLLKPLVKGDTEKYLAKGAQPIINPLMGKTAGKPPLAGAMAEKAEAMV